jgi:hypothetical protein
MKITAKDRVFLAVLPSLAAAACYGLFSAKPSARTAALLEQRLDELGSETQILERRGLLSAQHSRLRTQLTSMEAHAAQGQHQTAIGPLPEDPLSGLDLLQTLAAKSGVHLLNASQVSGQPQMQKSLAQEALIKAGIAQPHAWTILLEATYAALTGLLEALSDSRSPVVPETLSMQSSADEGKPNYWVLTIWL